ncbi:MAG: hypothetical protein IPO53_10630 [Chitinophagaceae bacterium]|nr:hypothetical protein [Chitinophagaceae bacterium]
MKKQEKAAPQSPEVFNLGLAESKIPGRELGYLLVWSHKANPTAPNSAR